jgi:ketosteroid isomerase-like protein
MSLFGEESEFALVLQYRDSPGDDAVAQRNRQTLLTAFEALLEEKGEEFWKILDPEIVFYEPDCLPWGGIYRGVPDTIKAHANNHTVFDRVRAVVESISAADDIAMLYQTIDFRVRANGNTLTTSMAEMFRFRNGKVIEWRELFFDPWALTQAIEGRR